MTDESKKVRWLGKTVAGSVHDYRDFKNNFPPEYNWLDGMQVEVDLGYQGIVKDYPTAQIAIPFKKPRKSRNNPDTGLSDSKRQQNRLLSSSRVVVEHAVAGLKRFSIVVHNFRNHLPHFIDTIILLIAGLWNFSRAFFHLMI